MSLITNNKSLPKQLREVKYAAQKARQEAEDEALRKRMEGDQSDRNRKKQDELQNLFEQLQRDSEELRAKRTKAQNTHLHEEAEFQENMNNLEERLKSIGGSYAIGEDELDSKKKKMRNMHESIQGRIEKLMFNVDKVVEEQENNLVRAFRNRLMDVEKRYEVEKAKNKEGSVEWVLKHDRLTQEKAWFQDLTTKLQTESKILIKENRRYGKQLKTQEEDREFLIKQLVSVKKENARLRFSLNQAQFSDMERERIGLPPSQPASRSGSRSHSRAATTFPRASSPMHTSSPSRLSSRSKSSPGLSLIDVGRRDKRSAAIIAKLKKNLAKETKKHNTLRTQHKVELASRTVMQNYLKKCIEDVREEIAERKTRARRRSGSSNRTKIDPRSIPLEDFTAADRINVMEWLLSQDHVIYLLYEKLFPRPGTGNSQASSTGGYGLADGY